MSDVNIPGVSDETQRSLKERWAAGRASDEAAERRLETPAETPEKKRLLDRIRDLKNGIKERLTNFRRAETASDANLERRYGQGMTEAERAEDAALVAQADQLAGQTEAHLDEVILLEQPRRPAGETPVHEAYRAHAERRAPEYEIVPSEHEAIMQEAETAAKELDSDLRLTSETYNGRRVIRFTHTEFPEVTWLMPVEAMSEEDARNYLENNLHRTYNEKMAKIEAQAITLPMKPLPVPVEAPDRPIMRIGGEGIGEVAERAAELDKKRRTHEKALQNETDLEQRLALARDVREGRVPTDELDPGQEKWIGKLLDDQEFARQERRLAIARTQRLAMAAELGLPPETEQAPSSPSGIVVGEPDRSPRPSVPPPEPGSRPPGVPNTPIPAPEEKSPGIPPPPPGEVVELSRVLPKRGAPKAATEAPAPPTAPAPEALPAEAKKEADWQPIVEKARAAYDQVWSAIKGQITEMIRLDPANIERVREMHEDAQNIEEEKILKELVGIGMIGQQDVEVVRGSDALDPLAGFYIKIYEDALSEAERLVAEAGKPPETPPATKETALAVPEPAPEAKAEPSEKKRRIDVTFLASEVDFLTKRWAFLASDGKPNTKIGRSIDALIDDMGGDVTKEGRTFKAFVDATAELHKKSYAGATKEEMKPFEDAARKAFVAFRDLVEPPKAPKKPRGRGKRGPQPEQIAHM